MSAKQDPNTGQNIATTDHRWAPITFNRMNFVCVKCGAIGYITKYDSVIRASHKCGYFLTSKILEE